MSKPIKIDGYTGNFYRMADRIGGKGQECVYYVVYKKDGKVIEAKAGWQYADDMTPAKAASYRSNFGIAIGPICKKIARWRPAEFLMNGNHSNSLNELHSPTRLGIARLSLLLEGPICFAVF